MLEFAVKFEIQTPQCQSFYNYNLLIFQNFHCLYCMCVKKKGILISGACERVPEQFTIKFKHITGLHAILLGENNIACVVLVNEDKCLILI